MTGHLGDMAYFCQLLNHPPNMNPTAITDTHLRLGRRSRRTALAGSRSLFVEYRVDGHTYYGVVLRQCEQMLHVYPPPLSVLALVDTDHRDILNLGWEDFELEYETVDAKKVVQVMQSDDEIVRLNDQLSQQSGGGHGHVQEQHGGGTGLSRCPDTDPLTLASTHLVSTKENTPTNVVALTPSPKKNKATQPKMSTSKQTKQTTLGSFPNFAKHAEKLSEMKPKKEGINTPQKQTTLDSFVTLADKKSVSIDPKDLERKTYEWNGVWYYDPNDPLFFNEGGPVGQFDSNGHPITDSDWRPNVREEQAYSAWYEAYTTKVEHRST